MHAHPLEFHWLSNVPLGTTICVTGIIGNILSVYIWRRIAGKSHQFCHSTALYLFSLGIVDIILLILFFLTESISTANPVIKTSWLYARAYAWLFYPLLGVFTVASIWTIVGVTVNRWVLVSFPMKSRAFYTTKNTMIGIAGITCFAFVVNIPHWFKYTALPGVNQTGFINLTDFGSSVTYMRYEFWCHCMVLVLVPWCTIAVLNLLMMRTLRNRIKEVSCATKRMKDDRNLTVMLLIITFTFLLLIAWQCITQCFYMLMVGEPNNTEDWKLVSNAYAFGKLGVIFNSATNWLIYGICGSKFRSEIKEVIIELRRKDDCTLMSNQSSTYTISLGKDNESLEGKHISSSSI